MKSAVKPKRCFTRVLLTGLPVGCLMTFWSINIIRKLYIICDWTFFVELSETTTGTETTRKDFDEKWSSFDKALHVPDSWRKKSLKRLKKDVSPLYFLVLSKQVLSLLH